MLLHRAISESPVLIPTPGQGRELRVGEGETERLEYLIAFRGIARVGTEREWRGAPLASAGAGILVHAWTVDKKALDTAVPGSLHPVSCWGGGLSWNRQSGEKVGKIPLCRGHSGLIPSALSGVNSMTALLNCTSGFSGSLLAPSSWLNSLNRRSEVSGLLLWSWSELLSLGTGFSVQLSKLP